MILLLHAGDPCGGISAVLVEGKRFCYIYGSAGQQGVKHGQQEVVDMQLQTGESILGARLVQQNNSSEEAAQHEQHRVGWALAGAATTLLSAGAEAALLVLLTQRRVLVLKLKA